MKVVSIILSILMILCGFACMFTPVATFLAMGYFFAIMFFVYGLMGIIRAFTKKDMSTIQIVISVLALIVGLEGEGSKQKLDMDLPHRHTRSSARRIHARASGGRCRNGGIPDRIQLPADRVQHAGARSVDE